MIGLSFFESPSVCHVFMNDFARKTRCEDEIILATRTCRETETIDTQVLRSKNKNKVLEKIKENHVFFFCTTPLYLLSPRMFVIPVAGALALFVLASVVGLMNWVLPVFIIATVWFVRPYVNWVDLTNDSAGLLRKGYQMFRQDLGPTARLGETLGEQPETKTDANPKRRDGRRHAKKDKEYESSDSASDDDRRGSPRGGGGRRRKNTRRPNKKRWRD